MKRYSFWSWRKVCIFVLVIFLFLRSNYNIYIYIYIYQHISVIHARFSMRRVSKRSPCNIFCFLSLGFCDFLVFSSVNYWFFVVGFAQFFIEFGARSFLNFNSLSAAVLYAGRFCPLIGGAAVFIF